MNNQNISDMSDEKLEQEYDDAMELYQHPDDIQFKEGYWSYAFQIQCEQSKRNKSIS